MQLDDETEDAFWRNLRRAVDEARVESTAMDSVSTVDAAAVASAEQLLGAVDAAGLPPLRSELGAERIDALVAQALAIGPADAARPKSSPHVATRRLLLRGWRRVLALAAALCLSPVFLLGAGTAATVVAVVLRNVRETLDYRDGVRYMVSDASPPQVTNPAQGITVARLFWGVKELRKLAVDPEPAIAQAAREVLRRMLEELLGAKKFVLRPMEGDLVELWSAFLDPARPQEVRLQAMDQFSDLMIYGIAAVNEVASMPQPGEIERDNGIFRRQLQAMLEAPFGSDESVPASSQAIDESGGKPAGRGVEQGGAELVPVDPPKPQVDPSEPKQGRDGGRE